MLELHNPPVPAACDVCKYAVEHQIDPQYEHARTRLATLWLLQDLEDLSGEPARLSGLVIYSAGVAPGPVHELEPRHWFWAMFYESDIRLTLQGGVTP